MYFTHRLIGSGEKTVSFFKVSLLVQPSSPTNPHTTAGICRIRFIPENSCRDCSTGLSLSSTHCLLSSRAQQPVRRKGTSSLKPHHCYHCPCIRAELCPHQPGTRNPLCSRALPLLPKEQGMPEKFPQVYL